MNGCCTNLCLGTELISLYETGGGIGFPLSLKKVQKRQDQCLHFRFFLKNSDESSVQGGCESEIRNVNVPAV